MIFKKVAVEYDVFDETRMEELREKVMKACMESPSELNSEEATSQNRRKKDVGNNKNIRLKEQKQDKLAKELTQAFLLCNNVSPVYPDANDKTVKEF
jgi:hypothetical protein